MSEQERREHNLAIIHAIAALSDESFSRFWNNPLDAEYDDYNKFETPVESTYDNSADK